MEERRINSFQCLAKRKFTQKLQFINSKWTFKFLILLIIIIANANLVKSSESINNTTNTNKNKKIFEENLKIIQEIAGKSFSNVQITNGTFRTGNTLWDSLLNKCTVDPTVSCLQSNVYSYLDDKIAFNGDLNVGSGVCFKKNTVDVNKYSKEANVIYVSGSRSEDRAFDEENEVDSDEESETPFEEVTDALYDKGVKFLVTHDLKLKLPQLFFNGATLRLSPRALTKTGALVHVDFEPEESVGEGRIFFKKIKKYIKKKLLMAAIAIILVIKLIALKLIFVLPLILGVTTAKKMFLKLLLFLFPALSHIFKLCSWYQHTYHTTTKYHHHHHLIHHKQPHGHGYHPSHGHHQGAVVVRPHAAGPPTNEHYPQDWELSGPGLGNDPQGVVVVHPHAAGPPTHEHYPQDWELSGSGLGNEYIAAGIHRNAIASFKPDPNDVNDINAWGLGLPPGASMDVSQPYSSNSVQNVQQTGQKIHGNAGRPVGPPNPYNRNKKKASKDPAEIEKEALIRAASLAARAPPSPVRDEILRVSAAKLHESNRIKADHGSSQDPDTLAADKFYGHLLDKVDSILLNIGASVPGCKERAVCSLYRDPFGHTPYSNLVSNELSKDSSELVPPADSKKALRYYAYVQAARDGQESKDCDAVYPNCTVDFNKKKR